MQRIRIIGLCLVAMFAFSAMAAASATALPEIKLEKGAFPVPFDSTSGAGSLTTVNHIINCESDTNTGLLANGMLADHVLVTFHKCTTKESILTLNCTSAGEPTGLITTKLLHGWIGYLKANPATEGKETGVLLGAESGTELASFECVSGAIKISIKVTGEVIGGITPLNVAKQTKFTLSFTQIKNGEQTLQNFQLLSGLGLPTPLFMTGVHLTSSLGNEPAAEVTSDTLELLGGAEGVLEA